MRFVSKGKNKTQHRCRYALPQSLSAGLTATA